MVHTKSRKNEMIYVADLGYFFGHISAHILLRIRCSSASEQKKPLQKAPSTYNLCCKKKQINNELFNNVSSYILETGNYRGSLYVKFLDGPSEIICS